MQWGRGRFIVVVGWVYGVVTAAVAVVMAVNGSRGLGGGVACWVCLSSGAEC